MAEIAALKKVQPRGITRPENASDGLFSYCILYGR